MRSRLLFNNLDGVIVATKWSNNAIKDATDRQADMDGHKSCFSLTLKRKDLLKIVSVLAASCGIYFVLRLCPLRWRHYVPPERWYLTTSPNGVITQKVNINM
jgi:hypothetical protein